jgi:hypothetical protein
VTARTAAQLLKVWHDPPQGARAFLLGLTSEDIEVVSRVACKDGHPLQQQALAFLRALYATD